jgi:hypothetical protein
MVNHFFYAPPVYDLTLTAIDQTIAAFFGYWQTYNIIS